MLNALTAKQNEQSQSLMIAAKFNTYRFADYKARVIDLLERVCTVSIETVKILREMELKMKAHAHTRHTS